jgi:hypothetical protein
VELHACRESVPIQAQGVHGRLISPDHGQIGVDKGMLEGICDVVQLLKEALVPSERCEPLVGTLRQHCTDAIDLDLLWVPSCRFLFRQAPDQ